MRVLFIIPKVSGRFPGADIPHLGIGYLAATLTKYGIEVQILDMRLGYNHRKVHETLDLFNPQLVGITVYSFGYRRAYSLIDEISNHADCKIVLGGPHISAIGAKALRESEADFAVKGEGEKTLLELCKAIEKSNPGYGDISGLVWRCGDEVIENGNRSFIDQLDSLPFPAYNNFELEKYFCYKDRLLPLITSRGCPHHCIFCSVNLCMGRKFRPRSAENVVNEIEYWYDQGWRKFEFHDDNFSSDIDRAKRICDLLVRKNLGIEWGLPNGVRADRLDEKLLEKMKASGCSRVAFGIESANNDVLKKIKKGVRIEQVEEAIKMVKKLGMDIIGFFIVGHPTESYQDFMESFAFARRQPFDQINFYNLVPYPGTELLKWVKENGTLLYPEEVYLNKISYWEAKPIFETVNFSVRERRKAYRLGHSLERKSISRLKLGRFWGWIGWLLSSSSILERIGIRVIKGTKMGRKLYRLARRC